MISEEALQRYKTLYLRKYGVELSDQEATNQAMRVLQLVRVVYEDKGKDKK